MHPKIKEQMALDGYSDDACSGFFFGAAARQIFTQSTRRPVAATKNLDSLIAQPDD